MTTKNTEIQYRNRLDKVVDYIYDNLESDVSIDRLAEIACLSPYHWHRIYSSMRGESVAATVKRLRMHRAAERLAHTDMDIPNIATQAGYNTVESFNRAFKQVFDLPPATYRERGSHAEYGAAIGVGDAKRFNITVQTLPSIHCASVAHSGPYLQIDQAMGKLFASLQGAQLLPEAPRMFAQFVDDPDLVAADELRSYACMPIDAGTNLPETVESKLIEPGLVATLHYQGPYVDMKPAYQWLYGVWLPQSGYEPADQPAIEEYLNSPQFVAPNELLTDIHLPLQEQS